MYIHRCVHTHRYIPFVCLFVLREVMLINQFVYRPKPRTYSAGMIPLCRDGQILRPTPNFSCMVTSTMLDST